MKAAENCCWEYGTHLADGVAETHVQTLVEGGERVVPVELHQVRQGGEADVWHGCEQAVAFLLPVDTHTLAAAVFPATIIQSETRTMNQAAQW